MKATPMLAVDRLVRRVHQATEVDIAFGGAVVAGNAFAINRLSGAHTGALHNLLIRTGLGVGGKAMSLGRPVSVPDYQRADGITHEYDRAVAAEGLLAVFAIPVVVGSATRAVVYGGLRRSLPVGGRTLDAAVQAVASTIREIEIAEEVERRLAERVELRLAEQRAHRDESPVDPVEATQLAQRLRDAQAEIAAIAGQACDPAIRARLDALSRNLREPLTCARGPLSPREIDVLVQVAAGYTNREVADRLNLGPTTVKAYLQSVMRKLGTGNRVATAGAARRLGLIP
jgi:DNA-binding NarL/FixJ family response regulator